MSDLSQKKPVGLKKSLKGLVRRLLNIDDPADLKRQLRHKIILDRKAQDSKIPKIELTARHISHLKVLLNRNGLLEMLPKNAVCAEIGVDQGEFSSSILTITSPAKLHLIDAWGDPDRYHDELKLMVREKFKKEIDDGRVEVNVGYSTDVFKKFPDAYFDWVYLDTDHSYETTAAELAILKSKMKAGGIIAGHDYSIGNWIDGIRYGVIEATHEFCVKEDWELLYLTCETINFRSFALRKL